MWVKADCTGRETAAVKNLDSIREFLKKKKKTLSGNKHEVRQNHSNIFSVWYSSSQFGVMSKRKLLVNIMSYSKYGSNPLIKIFH